MKTKNTCIPLADGRRLAARLWLPDSLPAPAILEYLPYRLGDGTAARDDGNYPVFAAAGFAGVRVDIAGTGDSDGHLADEYLEDELAAGEEVIAWIAAQQWCSGAVGMIGISWGGFNGLQIAMRRPPALKAIVTVCSTDDRYRRDIHYLGGCQLTDNFNWGAQMTAYSCRPPDPQVRDDWREVWLTRMRRLPFLAGNWLRHPRRDSYWQHGSVCADWGAIECAVLAVGGWADAYCDAPAILAEHLRAPTKAWVGPWEHRYPNIAAVGPRGDFHGEVIRWFERWLKGAANDAENLPAYRAYIQEHDAPSAKLKARAGRWVCEREWPPSAPAMELFLAEGRLGEAAGEGEVRVASAQHVGAAAGNFCAGMRVDDELPDEQRGDDALSVCFDGDALAAPLEILGAPVVEVEFSADQPQALLAIRLCDVAADGASRRVSFMVMNLAHHNGHARPAALLPGRRYQMRIALRHCGHRFAVGHRLRLAFSTSYWPMVWPSPGAAAVSLHLHGCRLLLPRREGGDELAPSFAPAAAPTVEVPGHEVLRAPGCSTTREVLADGTHRLTLDDDLGATRNPHNGMEAGATVRQVFAVHASDPLTARAQTRWEFTHRRGEWNIRVVSENWMHADADAFYLRRKVVAFEGEEGVLEREWDEVVPRDGCF